MDPVMMLVIVAIIAAILLVEFNKQQNTKHAEGSHISADVQQLYLLKAAEHKIEVIEDLQKSGNTINNTIPNNIEQELANLTKAFEKGDIPLKEFNLKLDGLLNNLGNTSLAQAS
ncbi:hypothetical protein AAFN85_29250 [Mucilaginibacter sp. CAU 1740]|uniref:hypothetical protein n=1 Tax=Mucilaginibacter sp. CAU 1740 TaxID=3140365 RepID=UPI00325BDD03